MRLPRVLCKRHRPVNVAPGVVSRVLLVLLCGSLGFGCFSGIGGGCEDGPELPDCNQPYTGASLDGQWRISAHGKRFACTDRRLEGSLDIDTSVPLSIASDATPTSGPATGPEPDNESDAFVQRIERADFVLSGDKLPRPVSLTGQVRGSCVVLTLTEELPDDDKLEYHLDGYIDAKGSIHGSFTGEGPELCLSSGSFSARVR